MHITPLYNISVHWGSSHRTTHSALKQMGCSSSTRPHDDRRVEKCWSDNGDAVTAEEEADVCDGTPQAPLCIVATVVVLL